jgi:hypothetical protein
MLKNLSRDSDVPFENVDRIFGHQNPVFIRCCFMLSIIISAKGWHGFTLIGNEINNQLDGR